MRLERLAERAAERFPERTAVCWHGEEVEYGELWTRACAAAGRLTDAGVTAGDRVGVWARKSPDVVAVMQACLIIGAAYVPIAPANPPARVQAIIDSCSPKLVAVDGTGQGPGPGVPTVTVDSLVAPSSGNAARPTMRHDDSEIAYVLFTSGSTGTPKGVPITHRNAWAFVDWAVKATGLSAEDRLSNHASFNFDLSVFDLYGAFAAGASVHIVPEEEGYHAESVLDFLVRHRISVWYSVPSVMSILVQADGVGEYWPRVVLRRMVLAGEPIDAQHLRRAQQLLPAVSFSNWYGPTETNVVAAYEVPRDLDPDTTVIPIGKPASGAALELVGGASQDEGRLHVTGPTVMGGYWGGAPLEGRTRDEGDMVFTYDTGDMMRRDEEGHLVFLGREDSMVKIRGHRVDTGEIESALRRHPDIADAVVIAAGAGLASRLVAFTVPRDGVRHVGLLSLKGYLGTLLPPYMNIDERIVIHAIPLNMNGKRDVRRLAASIETSELKKEYTC